MSKATRSVLDYCADLLSEPRGETFLKALFRHPKGEWVSVGVLCGDTGVQAPPAKGPGTDLVVVWLDEPAKLDGYSTIVFFSPAELWSTAAIYNRERLLDDGQGG